MKQKIENFVDEIIEKNDFEVLDILGIFSYSLPSKSGYYDDKKERVHEGFKKWFHKVCVRNLQKKYNLKAIEIKEKMGIFLDFLNSIPDFLSYKTFDDDKTLLREILIDKSSKILVQNSRDCLHDLPELDKKILSFVLNYTQITQDSMVDKENGNITYSSDDIKEWTYIYNLLFDEELKERRFRAESYGYPSEHREYSFWQLGDELVKIGIGYWIFYLSATRNVNLKFIIPNFLYETIKSNKEKLLKLEAFEKRINEIKKGKAFKKVEKWGLEEFEGTEAVNEMLESEIEASINLELLEEGLELIGKQYPASVGPIDILCRDKEGNFVVIELKRGKGTHKVVGQIQKYMAWVIENLAKDKQVRGIIVVSEYDKGLEYAIKGSKFPIAIKKFGQEPPTEGNIKYCTGCGKPNRKSAKYCIKCGQEFGM